MLDIRKRDQNEKKFTVWYELPGGGRKYYFEVQGFLGYKARYVKEVDEDETTVRFYQEIYDETGKLTEAHEKFPVDQGHKKVQGNEP
jgi:hypothetical protein